MFRLAGETRFANSEERADFLNGQAPSVQRNCYVSNLRAKIAKKHRSVKRCFRLAGETRYRKEPQGDGIARKSISFLKASDATVACKEEITSVAG